MVLMSFVKMPIVWSSVMEIEKQDRQKIVPMKTASTGTKTGRRLGRLTSSTGQKQPRYRPLSMSFRSRSLVTPSFPVQHSMTSGTLLLGEKDLDDDNRRRKPAVADRSPDESRRKVRGLSLRFAAEGHSGNPRSLCGRKDRGCSTFGRRPDRSLNRSDRIVLCVRNTGLARTLAEVS